MRVPYIQLERKAQVIRDLSLVFGPKAGASEYARGVALIQLLRDLVLDANPQFLGEYLEEMEGMEHSLAGPKTALLYVAFRFMWSLDQLSVNDAAMVLSRDHIS